MLPDADAVLGAMESARPGAGEGAIWLQMSTIGEQGTERCIARQLARGAADNPDKDMSASYLTSAPGTNRQKESRTGQPLGEW